MGNVFVRLGVRFVSFWYYWAWFGIVSGAFWYCFADVLGIVLDRLGFLASVALTMTWKFSTSLTLYFCGVYTLHVGVSNMLDLRRFP